MKLEIGNSPLTINDVVNVARNNYEVEVSESTYERVENCRESIRRIIDSGQPVYGVTTGVGKLAMVSLNSDQLEIMQRNLLLSHAAGTGELLEDEVVRAAMLLRAASLAKGNSGVRVDTLRTLVEMINKDIVPLVPSQGSVGSSGDLAPLAHIALTMMGVGTCKLNGRKTPAMLALKSYNLDPLVFSAKEALALINGTQIMTAIMALNIHDSRLLVKTADVAGSMSLEAIRGMSRAFEKKLHDLRPHKGQSTSAANIRQLISGSSLVDSAPQRVQDAYSLRCMPVVHGATRDTLEHVENVVTVELNSATDNPSIFPDEDDVISGGNFHGQPIALVSDFLGIAISEIGNIAERRVNRMLDGTYEHLPLFLVPNPGINSGLMIPQYTAAALASENKGLAFPNSADSITTSAHQEDHNSMGTIAARNARSILANVTGIYAIEMMTAAQALEFSAKSAPGKGVKAAYEAVRDVIAAWDDDRYVYPDIEAMKECISSGKAVAAAEEATGELL